MVNFNWGNLNREIKINKHTRSIIIVVFVTAITFSMGVFLLQEARYQQITTNLIKQNQEGVNQIRSVYRVQNQTEKEEELKRLKEQFLREGPTLVCDQSDIGEFGEFSLTKVSVVYVTSCMLKHGIVLFSYYVSDLDKSFNKKIHQVLLPSGGISTPSAGGRFVSLDQKILKITTNDKGREIEYIDMEGKKVINFVESPSRQSTSPNKNFNAIILSRTELPPTRGAPNELIVRIVDIHKNINKEFSFSNSLEGVYVAGWSPDDEFLYIAGGLYEFSAPAKLWRINTKNGDIKKYESINGLTFPVTIYPERKVAYVSNSGFNETVTEIDLYELNLERDVINKIITETAIDAFSELRRIGDNLYYKTKETQSNSGSIKRVNVKNFQKDILEQGGSLSTRQGGYLSIIGFANNKLLFFKDNDYYTMNITLGDKEFFGRRLGNNTANVEYISTIIGVRNP